MSLSENLNLTVKTDILTHLQQNLRTIIPNDIIININRAFSISQIIRETHCYSVTANVNRVPILNKKLQMSNKPILSAGLQFTLHNSTSNLNKVILGPAYIKLT